MAAKNVKIQYVPSEHQRVNVLNKAFPAHRFACPRDSLYVYTREHSLGKK